MSGQKRPDYEEEEELALLYEYHKFRKLIPYFLGITRNTYTVWQKHGFSSCRADST